MQRDVRRRRVKRSIGYTALVLLGIGVLGVLSIQMPGQSYAGPLPPLTEGEDSTRERLATDVGVLSDRIGDRNSARPRALDSAAAYIESSLRGMGYVVTRQGYTTQGGTFQNLEVTIPGRRIPNDVVVVAGHYDTVFESPGADDNASGTAAVLELARLLKNRPIDRSIRLIAFANEEPPYFWADDRGSLRYARAAQQRGDHIIAMVNIETVGYYSEATLSQRYPRVLEWFYPNRGNFIAFVGNLRSRSLVRRSIRAFRDHTRFPSEGIPAPMQLPGMGWADQWSALTEGYNAVMITDTGPYRNGNYHLERDRPATLDFSRMARVVRGVARIVVDLAR